MCIRFMMIYIFPHSILSSAPKLKLTLLFFISFGHNGSVLRTQNKSRDMSSKTHFTPPRIMFDFISNNQSHKVDIITNLE